MHSNLIKILVLLNVLAALLIVAVVISMSTTSQSSQNRAVDQADPVLETDTQSIDVDAVVDFTAVNEFGDIAVCLELNWDELNQCYDDFLRSYAGDKLAYELLAELELARQQQVEIENNCHPMTHAIGRRALERQGNVGDAFDVCDLTCHSGCYHGVMERLFFTEEQLAAGTQHVDVESMRAKVPDICAEDKFSDPSGSVIFQCLHGVGHALLYSLDYDLELALEMCDLLETGFEDSSCYGGVFMENVTAFEKSKRDVDFSDPHYPCNKLEDKYQSDCYMMQTSIMLEAGLSTAEMAVACEQAPAASECFVSIGRDASNMVRSGNGQTVVDTCEQHTDDLQLVRSCVQGVIYALIDNTWDGKYALPFCQSLNGDNVELCIEDAANYLGGVYQLEYSEIASQCEQFASDAQQCRHVLDSI